MRKPNSELRLRVYLAAVFMVSAVFSWSGKSQALGLDRAVGNVLKGKQSLRVEGLSIYTTQAQFSRQVTISIRVVNAGAATLGKPFRTSIFPGVVTPDGLDIYYVTTTSLGAGKTIYISRTIIVPEHVDGFDVRVEADADHVLDEGSRANNVATAHYGNLSPDKGRWVSIGPRRITAPAVRESGLGQYDAIGRLAAIAIHPANPKIIYVGSPGELGHEGSGVWKTSDGGKSWSPITDSLPTLAIAAIAIDQSHPDRVYIATADYGVFRSDDSGTSWINTHGDLKVRRNTRDGDRTVLLVNPRKPEVLYLTSDDGVYRSQNSGESWTLSLSAGRATALVVDPLNPDVLYAGIQDKGVYKTLDGGILRDASWARQSLAPLPSSNISGRHGILLAINHRTTMIYGSPETVYAVFARGPNPDGTTGFELYRTTTGGNSWELQHQCSPPDNDNCEFTVAGVDPTNQDIVYLGGPSFLVSTNGGAAFGRVPPTGNDRQPASPHGDYHGLAIDPTDPKILYAASDGGIYRSLNRGTTGTWEFIGEGIANAEIYDLAEALALGPAVLQNGLIAGTQDNGNILYQGNPVWRHIFPLPPFGGDGAIVAFDPTDANIFYVMGQYQDSLMRSDGRVDFVSFANGLPTGHACATYNSTFHFQVHPSIHTILLASCGSLYRTKTSVPPGAWTPIFTPTGSVVRSAVDPSTDFYYAGTGQGRLYAGPSGKSMQEIFKHSESLSVSDIEVDPVHPEIFYASFAPPTVIDRKCGYGTGKGRIYRLTRSFPITVRAVDITADLPVGLCVNTLAIDRKKPLIVYAGTNKGVYRGRSADRGTTWSWEPYNNGMPLTDVRDLEVHPTSGHLHTATYGRGAFEVINP